MRTGTETVKPKTFFPDGRVVRVLNTKLYFYVIFWLHLGNVIFKLKCFQKVNVISKSLMVSNFHKKRLPRICCDVITIVCIQN